MVGIHTETNRASKFQILESQDFVYVERDEFGGIPRGEHLTPSDDAVMEISRTQQLSCNSTAMMHYDVSTSF